MIYILMWLMYFIFWNTEYNFVIEISGVFLFLILNSNFYVDK